MFSFCYILFFYAQYLLIISNNQCDHNSFVVKLELDIEFVLILLLYSNIISIYSIKTLSF